jgi:uncharacterized membrane protein YbaN (DUF454 family)
MLASDELVNSRPAMTVEPPPSDPPGAVARVAWTGFGLLSVGVGSIGIVVPGLPTTVFFIIAAWAFSKSSPRLEAWVLNLPTIGPLVRDYRAGLGIPKRAKITAVVMICFFVGLSSWLVDGWIIRSVIIGTAVVGLTVILAIVPTKETVLRSRESS